MKNFFEKIPAPAPLLKRVAEFMPFRRDHEDPPLRAELFGAEQLANHAKFVAEQHKVGLKEGSNRLLARLGENEKILQAFNRTTLLVDKTRTVTPAAEWLLDNFYLIEEQIQTARRHLPRGYSRELPKLSNGPSARLPRVYDLILELIAHVDAQIDISHLSAFVGAYQTVTPLNLGELWAIPIMLRLGLIENLRRITIRLTAERDDRDLADFWANRLQAVAETNAADLILVVADMARAEIPLSHAFVTEFCQRLARWDPAVHFARNWIEQRLGEHGRSVEQCILQESQSQAADQVSISHTIGSLRFIGTTDWRDFVEDMSVVEKTLRQDPAKIYGAMDFATRDSYRHRVEAIARFSGVSENDVAWKAVDLAEQSAKTAGKTNRTAHVGYFLIDKGQAVLESATKVDWPLNERIQRLIRRFPLAFYLGGMAALLIPAMFVLIWQAQELGITGWRLLFLSITGFVCFSQFAVTLVNWCATALVKPRPLPRMDFSEGIAGNCSTMVVIPTMLGSAEGIDHLLETVEVHYLANRDKNLYLALLTDLRDADAETKPEDADLVKQITDGVAALNQKYQSDRPNIFYLFHRPRKWNEAEKVWMGYERKRGKLTAFNALLRGHGAEGFSVILGNRALLPQIRFVITLDTDTQLPRDAARRLAGAIAHPLNCPQFDPRTGLISEGYGILQPRVGVSLPTANRSWFVKIFAGDAGIDPYTRTVSDVYQDLFNEGSFIGKGIYDVDAFEGAVRGRFPENTILSHDLIESLHARSALISDVELYEEHPSRYNADIKRRHRWIRGDWQIAQWLLPRVPGPDARDISNPLSALSQWKILDNLRRSLVPAALTLLLLGNWLLLPELGGVGSLMVLAIVIMPGLFAFSGEILNKPKEWPWPLHLRTIGRIFARLACQIILNLAFLAYDAYFSLDAVVRTLARLLFTRKRLLEWQTSSDAEKNSSSNLGGFYRTMWIAPFLAAVAVAGLIAFHPEELSAAAPLLALWLLAPALAWYISQPIVKAAPELTGAQEVFLRHTARKTWSFFETFVNEKENWLPPDNFQEHPEPVIATRTSPTNLGLALLANLAACDFGYLPAGKLIERTRNTFATMERMQKHRGHFYNWYDTRTALPLHPLYISMVDSGNLAGHLLVLSAGLSAIPDEPVLNSQLIPGLRDSFEILRGLVGKNSAFPPIERAFANAPEDLAGVHAWLESMVGEAAALTKILADTTDEVRRWAAAFEQGCREHLAELSFIAPWLPFMPKRDSVNPAMSGSTASSDPLQRLNNVRTLRDVSELAELLEKSSAEMDGRGAPISKELSDAMRQASQRALERMQTVAAMGRESANFANMDFAFLFDTQRELFSIGYSITERRRDSSYYDLLASEARLGGYVAIAQGQVPEKHWFSLGRLVAAASGEPVLISWSGSMFEYLMPLLVMPTYENTLMDQTYHASVAAQIKYGRTRGVPWGISESGYNLTDASLNYQYRAFGVPGLGFKRGLADDLVIAPYASVMALMVAPREACENLERLAAEKRTGEYGFYEAVDYTPSRVPPNETSVTIRSFMVHHQGMSLLSLAYVLLDQPMQRRFLAYAPFKAEELLLQERVPKAITTLSAENEEFAKARGLLGENGALLRIFTTPNTPSSEVHLLSNGNYHVMISNSGGGYSRWRDLALTRWREDGTRDCWGSFCYLRDAATGEFWSMAFQPAQELGRQYEAIFTQGRAEFRQRHGTLESHVEISVSPEDDVEMRRITLTNHSYLTRTIEFTTYAEVVLAPAASDAAHPAFSNLFVQTEFVQPHPAILCTRRARAEGENPPWLFQMMAVHGTEEGELSYETDRSRFIGRGRNLASPAAMDVNARLSNSVGSVLDPIVSLRRTLTIAPQETVQVEMVMGAAQNRETALGLIEKYHNARMADRLFDLSWTHSQVTLRHLDATEPDAQLYARMAGALIYANPLRRANASVLINNKRGQGGLWSYGISGDLPIALLRISDPAKMDLARRVVQAHSYWRMKGLAVELVIVNEDTSVYRQSLQDAIVSMIASGIEANMLDKPGGIFVRRLEQIPAEDRILLQSVARILLSDEKGSLEEQFLRREAKETEVTELKPTAPRTTAPVEPWVQPDLIFFNGLGGFTRDGKEYVITLRPDESEAPPVVKKNASILGFGALWADRVNQPPAAGRLKTEDQKRFEVSGSGADKEANAVTANTPAPWVNVMANNRFGTLVSESGSSYTWLENSHEYRLTPWNNDPVSDISGEVFYIRDDETGEFWSPTPLPARGETPYLVRHGFGYSVFEHTENGIATELWVYVARNAPVKLNVLKVKNLSGRPRKLSVFGYWEWVLADLRTKSLLHIQTEIDPATQALFARNPYNTEFVDRIAFVDVDDPNRAVTGDRKEFLGRNGSTANPAALGKLRLSGKTGIGLDPCAALQVTLELPPKKEREICFRLGAAGSLPEARDMVNRFRQRDASRDTLSEVHEYWNRTLGAVQVETPDPAADVLANGWLMYQTLSARLWGRTGFYQSGGAFGFRDQLQDAMALVHTEPRLLREQILLAAAHQFREGDVQHWWHPPSSRGVRTHFSDDYLWLVYATCRYVNCLNDTGVLDEPVPFLEGRALKPDEESYYDLPNRSGESGTLYEHCRRSIEHGLRFGSHGLPLIGCGDWNDGFNLIGEKGRGESVWLAFFLFEVLTEFGELARRRNDPGMVARCLNQAELLRQNIEAHSWDGQWYRRAYFDNGEPLGSQSNAECKIDSLPQSWSVLTSLGDVERSRTAMQAVEKHLVRRDAGLIQLFDPPFDKSTLNPGYIKGYAPGVRENGGQYTHGAIWTVMAFAKLGRHDLAWELFGLLNPVNHAKTAGQVAIYKVEPYVVAADVYGVKPHIGRGGWTWYTGSAGWMYRLAVETLLGLSLQGTDLRVQPRVPKSWPGFKIHYRYKNTTYHIVIIAVTEAPQITLDGQVLNQDKIPLVDDHNEHSVEIRFNADPGKNAKGEPEEVIHFGK